MAQPSNVARLLAGIHVWNAAHPGQRIDPQAELAIAAHEGLSGGIGDSGHAFGPNQLNNAGGVLTGKFAGQTPGQINQWAWSPAGLAYALAGVAGVSGGMHGRAAIENIARRFERPANPEAEIADALAHYGLPAQGGAGYATGAPGQAPMASMGGSNPGEPPPPAGPNPALLANLVGSTNQTLGLGGGGQLAALLAGAMRPRAPMPAQARR